MNWKNVAALTVGLVLASSSIALAASSHTRFAPGQEMRRLGPVHGHPGASGYAPGHLMQQHRTHGASTFAPGHR